MGISPTEQEVVDMQCEVERKGRIFFPDFCKLCLRKFREFDEENFRQELFKVSMPLNIENIFVDEIFDVIFCSFISLFVLKLPRKIVLLKVDFNFLSSLKRTMFLRWGNRDFL